MKIWTIDDEKLDIIVNDYIDYVTNPSNFYRQTAQWKNSYIGNNNLEPENRALVYETSIEAKVKSFEDNLPILIYNLPKPQFNTIKQHFISLLHQIYLRHIDDEIGEIVLNSSVLQKVYRNYNFMLDTLCHALILFKNRESVGGFARKTYFLKDDVKFKYIECENLIVHNDLKRISADFKRLHQAEIVKAKRLTSSKFIDNYNKSLKEYRLVEYNKANEFITASDLSEHSKLYYQRIVDKIESKTIKEIDKADSNGRIYHLVTMTPKILRQYTNIKFIIDTKNSHPLLFNYFIFEYYFNKNAIDIENKNYSNNYNSFYLLLSSYISNNNIDNHYFSKELCNCLNTNGIGEEKIDIVKSIPKDVWQYLALTSKGELWDMLNLKFPQFTRSELKVELFSSVFYSNAMRFNSQNQYSSSFQKEFPNVCKIIRYYRKVYDNQGKESGKTKIKYSKERSKIQLAHKMMQLESYLFTQILNRLYEVQGFYGVGIHDAIAVFCSPISQEAIKEIMTEIYAKIGLCPTFSVELSDCDCGTQYIEELEASSSSCS